MCLRKTLAGKCLDYCDVNIFEKPRFQNVYRLQEIAKPVFSTFPDFKSVVQKLRFHDGLVCMVGLAWKQSCVGGVEGV